jgi:hypothetical protein
MPALHCLLDRSTFAPLSIALRLAQAERGANMHRFRRNGGYAATFFIRFGAANHPRTARCVPR